MNRLIILAIYISIIALAVLAPILVEAETEWEPYPDRAWFLTSEYGVESVTFRAMGYEDLSVLPQQVTFALKGCSITQPVYEKLNGLVLSELWIKPDGDKSIVTLKLSGLADGFSVNTSSASRAFPRAVVLLLDLLDYGLLKMYHL